MSVIVVRLFSEHTHDSRPLWMPAACDRYWTEDDVLITAKRDIARHYCAVPFGRFWLDLLTLLPLDYLALAWHDPYSRGFSDSRYVLGMCGCDVATW